SSRRRHTRSYGDWSSDVCSSDLMRDAAITGVGVGQSEDNPNESAIVVFAKAQPRVPIPAQIDGVRTKVIFGSEFRAQQAAVQKRSEERRVGKECRTQWSAVGAQK